MAPSSATRSAARSAAASSSSRRLGVERAGHQRVAPHVGVPEHRDDLVGQATVRGSQRPSTRRGRRRRARRRPGWPPGGRGGRPARPEAVEVPRHRGGRHATSSSQMLAERVVEVEHAVGGRHQQAVGQPGGEVGAVDEASVRHGTPAAATSRMSSGTLSNSGERDQFWITLTKNDHGRTSPVTRASPRTHQRPAGGDGREVVVDPLDGDAEQVDATGGAPSRRRHHRPSTASSTSAAPAPSAPPPCAPRLRAYAATSERSSWAAPMMSLEVDVSSSARSVAPGGVDDAGPRGDRQP